MEKSLRRNARVKTDLPPKRNIVQTPKKDFPQSVSTMVQGSGCGCSNAQKTKTAEEIKTTKEKILKKIFL